MLSQHNYWYERWADLVDSHVVCIHGIDEVGGVGLGADVNLALLRTHQEQVVFLLVEVKCCAAAYSKKWNKKQAALDKRAQ